MNPGGNKNIPAAIASNMDENDIISGHVELERPIGIKAEKVNKKNRKIKAEQGEDSNMSYNFQKSQGLMQKMHEEKMQVVGEDTKKMDALFEMKKEKLELDCKTYNGFMKRLELNHKTYEDNIERREEKLMSINTSDLSDIQRKFFKMKQREIFDKSCGKN